VKQNMFFSIKKADFDVIKNIDIDDFPCKEVPDEYFWANQLIIEGNEVNDYNFIFVNDDPTKTQSLSWIIDSELLHHTRSRGYLFIRKVSGFATSSLKNIILNSYLNNRTSRIKPIFEKFFNALSLQFTGILKNHSNINSQYFYFKLYPQVSFKQICS